MDCKCIKMHCMHLINPSPLVPLLIPQKSTFSLFSFFHQFSSHNFFLVSCMTPPPTLSILLKNCQWYLVTKKFHQKNLFDFLNCCLHLFFPQCCFLLLSLFPVVVVISCCCCFLLLLFPSVIVLPILVVISCHRHVPLSLFPTIVVISHCHHFLSSSLFPVVIIVSHHHHCFLLLLLFPIVVVSCHCHPIPVNGSVFRFLLSLWSGCVQL